MLIELNLKEKPYDIDYCFKKRYTFRYFYPYCHIIHRPIWDLVTRFKAGRKFIAKLPDNIVCREISLTENEALIDAFLEVDKTGYSAYHCLTYVYISDRIKPKFINHVKSIPLNQRWFRLPDEN